MEYQVEMTKTDVLEGFRGSCSMCPVARATRRTLNNLGYPKSWRVSVQGDGVAVRNSKGTEKVVVRGVNTFVFAFDEAADKRSIAPISFQLEVLN